MLLVNAVKNISRIHGIGLFAQQIIPQGTIVWRFRSGYDVLITIEDFKNLSEFAQNQVKLYSYYNVIGGAYILSGDDCRFVNHSINPNMAYRTNWEIMTIRNIEAGEELVINYDSWENLNKEMLIK